MFLRFLLLGIVILVTWLNVLPYLVPKKPKQPYDDEELRRIALSRGMKPIPKDTQTFLKLLDSPDNPITQAKVDLGKALFFDTNLSLGKTYSCASCHLLSKELRNTDQFVRDISHPQNKTDCMVCHIKDQSATDRLAASVDENGSVDPFHKNTLTILNSALAKYGLWDASSDSLYTTTKRMLEEPHRLGISKTLLLQRLRRSGYARTFATVFDDALTYENVIKALVAFEKTLLTRSAYDRFLEGDNDALSDTAKRGLRNFIELGCKGCHTGITVGGQTYQKFPARNFNYIINVTGVFSTRYLGRDVARFDFNFSPLRLFPFENTGGFLGKDNNRFFRVPILRNVTKTSPYFHNGAVFDLREAVYIMGKYQLGMELSEEQIDEITAFLKSLEGTIVSYKELP